MNGKEDCAKQVVGFKKKSRKEVAHEQQKES